MIGPKKLSTIRQELHRAFAAVGDDPLDWLEQRMAAPNSASGEREILQSLQRFLAATRREESKKKPLKTKK
jgi:hypothetical protein